MTDSELLTVFLDWYQPRYWAVPKYVNFKDNKFDHHDVDLAWTFFQLGYKDMYADVGKFRILFGHKYWSIPEYVSFTDNRFSDYTIQLAWYSFESGYNAKPR